MTPEEYGYEAKFSVRTNFLDSTFIRRRQQREGESYEDFVVDMHREMLKVIERLQKEFGEDIANGPAQYPGANYPATVISTALPIISIDNERIEIAIDNASTLDELTSVKVAATRAGLVSEYMQKLSTLMVKQ